MTYSLFSCRQFIRWWSFPAIAALRDGPSRGSCLAVSQELIPSLRLLDKAAGFSKNVVVIQALEDDVTFLSSKTAVQPLQG